MNEASGVAESIHAVFGGVRAEYFREELFELFTEPNYWPELRTPRPCFLVGGRGTGKTTVLRGLSYQGQKALEGDDPTSWQHIGIYWRVDTNVVSAFKGGRVDEERWTRIFGHYVNLRLVSAVTEFLEWAPSNTTLNHKDFIVDLSTTCASLSIPDVQTVDEFTRAVKRSLLQFEAAVNNIDDGELPPLSIPGRPVEQLLAQLDGVPALAGKTYYFLIDEFESLSDYQQRCINTLIKHAGDANYTFKIGVKETGHRERSTSSRTETLAEPADFATVDITRTLKDQDFMAFADRVCAQRLGRIVQWKASDARSVLPGVSMDEEVRLLGGELKARRIRESLDEPDDVAAFDSFSLLQQVFVGYWADSRGMASHSAVREFFQSPRLWRDRLNNHGYAMLFTLRRGVPGRKKIYAGFDTYVALADGNIRFLLQLVGEALHSHVTGGADISTPVAATTQSDAAQEVGLKALKNMPGASTEGAQLTKLVLSLGRVFGVMASHPEGHTPEVNQFRVDGVEDEWVQRLLDAGVMHLALTRFPGDKRAGSSGETRDWDYQLHPILAPYFVYSHRRKRRLSIRRPLFKLLIEQPNRAIEELLSKTGRRSDSDLPEQLTLFGGYYGLD